MHNSLVSFLFVIVNVLILNRLTRACQLLNSLTTTASYVKKYSMIHTREKTTNFNLYTYLSPLLCFLHELSYLFVKIYLSIISIHINADMGDTDNHKLHLLPGQGQMRLTSLYRKRKL